MKNGNHAHRFVLIAVVVFWLLASLRYLLDSISSLVNRSTNWIFIVMLAAYGFYLVLVLIVLFARSYVRWVNHQDWIAGLMTGYAALFSSCLLMAWLVAGLGVRDLVSLFMNSEGFLSAAAILLARMANSGLPLAFPVSLYGLYLAFKSLIVARRKKQTLTYGFILLLCSLMLLWRSYALVRIILGVLWN